MMSPSEFMLYATPVILLISQEVRAYKARRELKQMTDNQTAAINVAGQDRADVLQTTTIDVASKLAVHTSDKANAIGDELAEIHELVNGNTSALQSRIAELESQRTALEAQLKSANRHT
jgi:gas vesicle protein